MVVNRRGFLASATALAIGGSPAQANHLSWRRYFRVPEPLAKVRVIRLAASGKRVINDGKGDETALIVLPNQPYRGLLELRGFCDYVCIGGVIDTDWTGNMYTPSGQVVQGTAGTFKLQTSATPIRRPVIYLARLKVLNTHCYFGDLFRIGSTAPASQQGAWPDFYRHQMLIKPRFGWRPGDTAQFGEPPAPAHHGDICHSDLVKQEVGGTRHWFTGAVDASWGYQQEYGRVSFSTGYKEYRGPEGRAQRMYWDYVARPVRDTVRQTLEPRVFWTADDDAMVALSQYDPMVFVNTWIVPEAGIDPVTYVKPLGGDPFGPTLADGALIWPQTDWPENMAAYTGSVGISSAPPAVVKESAIGISHRITSVAALRDYYTGMRHLG